MCKQWLLRSYNNVEYSKVVLLYYNNFLAFGYVWYTSLLRNEDISLKDKVLQYNLNAQGLYNMTTYNSFGGLIFILQLGRHGRDV